MEKNIEQDYLAPQKTGQHNKEIEQKKKFLPGGRGGSWEAVPLLCRP